MSGSGFEPQGTEPGGFGTMLALRWASSGLSWRRKKMSLTFSPSESSCRCQMPTVSVGCFAWPGRSSSNLCPWGRTPCTRRQQHISGGRSRLLSTYNDAAAAEGALPVARCNLPWPACHWPRLTTVQITGRGWTEIVQLVNKPTQPTAMALTSQPLSRSTATTRGQQQPLR